MNPKTSNPTVHQQNLVLFDGVCNLCNHAVNFIIDHDPAQRFVFASLQSEAGQAVLQQYHIREQYLDSLVFIQDGQAYLKSTGALRIARHLSGFWPISYGFMVLPPFIRDFFYDIVAHFRYRIFGRSNECRIPTPELQARFLA